ncbi:FAD-dependent oxidoreductase [Candidatus Solirubrobacter pratensis]|uniref:FAD-dependent oxidoreductase n=1 Tax=Candidatus Solirubrobacter pratensis TaxID=1298857 RepID=UPI0004841705|nr:FAD-dependent oxidoreductase [Candidatus Solirubrobacter pratensis]
MSDPMRVLIAGGGVAALEAVLALRALAGDRVAVELLAPGTQFPHRPESVRSPFSGEPAPQISFDRVPITHHRGALAAVAADRREARTTDGGRLSYDRLIVATGARSVEAVHGATLFRGPVSAGAVEGALRDAKGRVVFALPAESAWALPIYELALLAAHERRGGPELMVVTHEPRPLDIFGRTASDAVARLLDRAGIEFLGDTVADSVLGDAVVTHDGRLITADAVIALPRPEPRAIAGLPEGFLEIDEHARVVGVPGVFAAGDGTAGPIKQGGLATQQADAAAERIAAEAGAGNDPRPYRPVLRGLLLTGEAPLYMRKDLTGDDALARPLRYAPPQTSRSPLWWPDEKIVGRYLSGYIAGGRAA